MSTRDYQLQYCKICVNKLFDPQQGIICSLTSKPADFQDYCPSFKAEEGKQPNDPGNYQPAFDVDANTASTGKRFVNMLVDLVIIYILDIIMGILYGIFLAVVSPDSLDSLDDSGTPLWAYAIGIFVYVSYYTFFESVAGGRTIGKMITGTRVVNSEGKTPSTPVIFKRSLCRIVPFEAFSFLGNSRGWHDQWSDTWVVNNK